MRLAMNTADEVWITRLKGALLRRSDAFGVTWRVLSVWTVLALSGVSIEPAFAQVEISNFSREVANPVCARTSVQVRWRIDFSENVGGIGQDGVVLLHNGLSGIDRNISISGQGSTYFIQGWSGTGDGDISIVLREDGLIPAAPEDDVSLPWAQWGPEYTVMRPPTVSYIGMLSAHPTPSGSIVSWNVTFSERVHGVDADDFALVMRGGVSGARITDVQGNGREWTVTASTGSGSGKLGLNLVDNDSIVTTYHQVPLGCQGTGNGNFTGAVYVVRGGASGRIQLR
jgi:hypothetical protein